MFFTPKRNPILFLPTPLIHFVPMHLLTVDISYKWNQTLCDFLCLASFTSHIFKVHPCFSMYQYFISFCCLIIFHNVEITRLSVQQLTDIWLYFHFWGILDNVAMNIHEQVFLWTYIFNSQRRILNSHLGVELLDHMVTLFNILSNC